MPGGAYDNWDAPGQGGAVGRVHKPAVERRQPEYHLSDRDDIHADEMTARAGGAGGSPWGNKQLAQRLRTNGDHTASYGNRGEATRSNHCHATAVCLGSPQNGSAVFPKRLRSSWFELQRYK